MRDLTIDSLGAFATAAVLVSSSVGSSTGNSASSSGSSSNYKHSGCIAVSPEKWSQEMVPRNGPEKWSREMVPKISSEKWA